MLEGFVEKNKFIAVTSTIHRFVCFTHDYLKMAMVIESITEHKQHWY